MVASRRTYPPRVPHTLEDTPVRIAKFRSEIDAEHAHMTLSAAGVHSRILGGMAQALATINPTQSIDLVVSRRDYPRALAELNLLAAELANGREMVCASCEYDLTGIEDCTTVCPECGASLAGTRLAERPWQIVPLPDESALVARTGVAIGMIGLTLLALGVVAMLAGVFWWLARSLGVF